MLTRGLGKIVLTGLALAACLCFVTSPIQAQQIRINEVDADQQGTDAAEFVELYDGGVGNTSLNGLVVVFYNGSNDTSYAAFDLDGFQTNAQGYFLIGNTGVVPTPSIIFNDNTLQNGADAVALYQANGVDFPNGTAVTTTNLVDALVYGANQPDDAELLVLLNAGQPQVNEAGSGNATVVSMHRCPNGAGGLRNTTSYALTTPSPGAAPSCPPTTGACCTGGSNCSELTPAQCAAISGAVFVGLGSTCTPGLCPVSFPGVKINEIRIDMPGTDTNEYIELTGPPGTSLNGLTLFIIGDGTGGSGVIERAINLAGQTIPADGYFLIAGDNNTFGATADLNLGVTQDMIENSDNLTFMLVAGFTGASGNDLDTNNDGVLDVTPWTTEIDRVCVIESIHPPAPTGDQEWYYFTDPSQVVGPDGTFVPGHVYRLPNGGLPWNVGIFDPTTGVDTPGVANAITGACCQGGFCDIQERNVCINELGGIFKGVGSVCGDGSICTGACCNGTDCALLDPLTCQGQGGVFQGAGTTCTPAPNPACGACMTIADARALPVGSRVKLCNVIISSTTDLIQSGTVKSFQIEDSSGAGGRSGLTVFGSNELIDLILSGAGEGTQIDVQGVTNQFNGLLELEDGSLPLRRITLGGNVGASAPVAVTTTDFQNLSPTAEGLESEIVTLSCVTFLDAGGTFIGGLATSNYVVTDGVGFATVRISSNQLDFHGMTIPSGPVTITGVFSQSDTAAPFDSNYQLLPRILSDLNDMPNCGAVGACCLGGGTCNNNLTATLCAGIGGVFQGAATMCANVTCPTADGMVINEIRVDQDGVDNDEYFEIKGPANVPLGSLTYIVLGDGAVAAGSGVIETVVPLSGAVTPADGVFLCARNTLTIGTPDLVSAAVSFENDDNVTHMLVEGFTGTSGQDLDTNDDGILDVTPWTRVLDSIAIVKDLNNPPVGTEWYYGPTVGPTPFGSAPFHVIRCAGALNNWIIGTGDLPPTGNDTPGAENDCSNACLTCYGDVDQSQRVDVDDIDEFVDVVLGLESNVCADVNLDGAVNGLDIRRLLQLILANGGAGTSCLPAAQKDIARCDNAAPPNDCPDSPTGFCQYQVDLNQAGISSCVVTSNPGTNQLVEGELICVACPISQTCGTPGDRVRFRWVNQDGLGNDCIFYATLQSAACQSCPTGKRFSDAPPPLAIKVMSYNLLNYNGADRTTQYQAILNAVLPDLIVCQEVNGASAANTFLNTVLNGAGGPGGYNMATFSNGPDSDNACYYRTSRLTFAGPVDHAIVSTSPRQTDRWRLTINGFTGPESSFYIYSAHLKAGNTAGDANDRNTAAQLIRAHANALPAGSNFMIAGDMNLYTSAEAAYQQLIGSQVDNDGRVFDPINRPGNWNANSSFRDIHTQSPHNNNPGAPLGAANGGLDDRFDFILCSQALLDGVALTYRTGSYHAFGNDGNHFNNDINDPPTIPQGAVIADALHGASDHLPVVMEILLP